MSKQCPNFECQSLKIIKDGKFKRSSDHQVIQRYRCKCCGRRFSNASFSLAKNQKKRTVNHLVFKLLGSGVSMRRIAKILNLNKNTIQRKVDFLATKAKIEQQKLLENLHEKIEHIQFDDLETSEHTKLKPVSVSIAVDVQSRMILGAFASQIPAKGHLAVTSRHKYGYRKSHHKEGLKALFKQISPTFKVSMRFDSDSHTLYPEFVKKYAQKADHFRFKGGRGCVVGQGELKKLHRDPLFCINHTCAMLRDNLKRLSRKTWCTTKKIEMLQKHLNIYLWYHNKEILSG